jgi:hypothetical protein
MKSTSLVASNRFAFGKRKTPYRLFKKIDSCTDGEPYVRYYIKVPRLLFGWKTVMYNWACRMEFGSEEKAIQWIRETGMKVIKKTEEVPLSVIPMERKDG